MLMTSLFAVSTILRKLFIILFDRNLQLSNCHQFIFRYN